MFFGIFVSCSVFYMILNNLIYSAVVRRQSTGYIRLVSVANSLSLVHSGGVTPTIDRITYDYKAALHKNELRVLDPFFDAASFYSVLVKVYLMKIIYAPEVA